VADTTVGGETISEDDFVVMIYPSANRDETVWDRPDRFDVTRSNAGAHLAFGTGIHVCLGATLARIEIRVVLQELAARYSALEVTGEVSKVSSVHVNQYRRVPVRLTRR
jgi:cytochrome P450